LCSKLHLEKYPILSTSIADETILKWKGYLPWKGHLPQQYLDVVDDDFVEELSHTDTIVLVADIRRSQDLMTYSPDVEFFRNQIFEFITKMREIVKSNYGIFDKFTGDGILCYFNDGLCKKIGKDYYRQMIHACREIMEFSTPFFDEWIKHIRKLPPNSSGIALGIDSGTVKFKDMDNHLFAIGDSIVWANRMSSVGKKGEIVLNNIPYHKVREFLPDENFESVDSITKGGESFTAHKLKLPIKNNNNDE
jgi:class 3 adenylate cyclase